MLYKFQSKKSADVLMLGDLTQRIFDIIEKPLEPRGAFLVEQLFIAIEKLEAAIAKDEALRKAEATEEDKPSDRKLKADRLGQRAFPFISLLKDALANEELVVWGV
jgi:Domain of unknown function (DUF1840)